MIVVASKPGQLANRLFVFSHFIALSADAGVQISDLAFDEYAPYFVGTKDDPFCRFPPRSSERRALSARFSRRWFYWTANRLAAMTARLGLLHRWIEVVRIDWWETFDIYQPDFIEKTRKKTVIVQGWLFSAGGALAAHKQQIRQFFTPDEEFKRRIDHFMETLRDGPDLVVGIHVRHGDYARFLGGKYFYGHHTYARVMDEVAALFAHERVRFLICSDQIQQVGKFGEHDVVLGPGHPVLDLYCLASCDRIAGPPSTFSLWASFYGDVPLYMIKDEVSSPSLGSFKVYGSQFDFPEVAAAPELS